MRSRFATSFSVLALLWVGLVVGISFIATPGKFQAPSLDLATAVDVGRHVFATSHIVQLVIVALLAVLAIRMSTPVQTALYVALALLLVQHIFVLPMLVERATSIIHGTRPAGPSPHLLYIALEVGKLVAATLAALWALSHVRDRRADERLVYAVDLFTPQAIERG
jgi:hypothetical protein